ncbi:unnamed protein product [Dovyalis caffra]|uniref:Secreted protein n=1 Tax=Dovyalis caffra TaxID=77055 RepID=A0AAV1R440_9ROSI|nr:unnamed protein product [Dovyalis caffra]
MRATSAARFAFVAELAAFHFVRSRCLPLVGWGKRDFPSRRIQIQSSHRFPYGYLVTTSPQSKTPPWYAPIRPPKAFVALVVHRSHG